jgi:hypothetical protein
MFLASDQAIEVPAEMAVEVPIEILDNSDDPEIDYGFRARYGISWNCGGVHPTYVQETGEVIYCFSHHFDGRSQSRCSYDQAAMIALWYSLGC